ncbi:MAG: conjugal transfer protein TraN, partial [Syntrophales bacterium]|nr:conjugal transfer protein TraN [Syntrophales bacterium]
CVQRANTYCCFNSKLGRIIHEQGRIQLQQFGASGDWGGAENPNCWGFTPEEFQMLDFSRIDLSEYFGDIKAKAASEVQRDMQRQVSDFYDKVQRK